MSYTVTLSDQEMRVVLDTLQDTSTKLQKDISTILSLKYRLSMMENQIPLVQESHALVKDGITAETLGSETKGAPTTEIDVTGYR